MWNNHQENPATAVKSDNDHCIVLGWAAGAADRGLLTGADLGQVLAYLVAGVALYLVPTETSIKAAACQYVTGLSVAHAPKARL